MALTGGNFSCEAGSQTRYQLDQILQGAWRSALVFSGGSDVLCLLDSTACDGTAGGPMNPMNPMMMGDMTMGGATKQRSVTEQFYVEEDRRHVC